jgi:glycerol dehydrogenase
MAKKVKHSPLSFVRTGPAQYVNRAGILSMAGDGIAPWGQRALISGGKKALAASEKPLTKSLDNAGIKWRKLLFTGESSPANIARIKGEAQDFNANVIIGAAGGHGTRTAGSLHPHHRRHLLSHHGVVRHLR